MSATPTYIKAAMRATWTVLFCVLLTLLAFTVQGQTTPARNGQNSFDFNIGTWKTHVRRLQHPLSGPMSWIDGDGVVTVRKIWGGKANLEEIELDSPSGHLEGLTLRLYEEKSHQWNLSWANANQGELGAPIYGDFHDGIGEFYDQEKWNGRTILVRQVYSQITHNSYHFEQSFSPDRGKTWEANFIADLRRTSERPLSETVSAEDRNHDFDFNFGHWTTRVSRLQQPLGGSKKWEDYNGASQIEPVWNGRASLFELNMKGPAGEVHGVGLRLYNTEAHQWSLNWANSQGGPPGVPTVGGFESGKGEFLDQELYKGRAIFVRNGFSNITAGSSRFEQAFSVDGGKTWETNWVMTFQGAVNVAENP
jgi:hypothetical protein